MYSIPACPQISPQVNILLPPCSSVTKCNVGDDIVDFVWWGCTLFQTMDRIHDYFGNPVSDIMIKYSTTRYHVPAVWQCFLHLIMVDRHLFWIMKCWFSFVLCVLCWLYILSVCEVYIYYSLFREWLVGTNSVAIVSCWLPWERGVSIIIWWSISKYTQQVVWQLWFLSLSRQTLSNMAVTGPKRD